MTNTVHLRWGTSARYRGGGALGEQKGEPMVWRPDGDSCGGFTPPRVQSGAPSLPPDSLAPPIQTPAINSQVVAPREGHRFICSNFL